MERVLLMNNQEGDDLIVSLAIEDTEPEETKSLILLRTPKYESVFEDHERGVSVRIGDHAYELRLASMTASARMLFAWSCDGYNNWPEGQPKNRSDSDKE